MNNKERVIIYVNSKWILRNLFVGVLISVEARYENGYGFYRPGLKIGVENDIFWAWSRVRIWRTRWQIATKNSQKYQALPPPPTHLPTHPKSKSCHIASFLLFYGNPKVFSFFKRNLACKDNSPPKKSRFNVSNRDFLYHFKKAKWWEMLMRLYYIYFELSSILI